MVDKWQSQDLNTLTLTPEPRGLCVCGTEGCRQPQHPFQQTAASCVAAMLLSRCAPHAVGLSGTDKAVGQGWGPKPALLPGCIALPPDLAATLEKGQDLEVPGGPFGG